MALTLTFNQPGIPAGDLDRGRTDLLTTDAGGGRAPVVSIDIGNVPTGSEVLVQALDEPPLSSPLLTQVSDTLWTLEWNAGAWGPFRIQATASVGTEVVSSVTRRISVRSPTFHLAYPSLSERYDPNAHLVPTVPSVQLTEMNEHSTNRALVDFHRELVQAIDTLSAGGIASIPDGSITEAKLDPAFVAGLVLTDGSHPMVGELDMSGSRIVDLGQPTGPTDAARLADADYTAGAGLVRTGQTLDVVAHADGSIVANPDSVQVGVLATDAQHGTRGGGTQHANVTPSSAGFASAADKTKLDGIAAGADVTLTALAAAAVPVSVNGQRITNLGAPIAATDAVRVQDLTAAAVVAGAGLVRAGTTLDVVAHADASIVVAADSVQVGVLATDAQHGTRGGGALHANVTPSSAGFASAADKTKLDGIAAGADVTLTALAAAAVPVSVNAKRITNLGTPTAATDAATRAYVDAAPPVLHSSTHADGGADEVNVAGLSGLLADPQTAGGIKTATTTVAVAAAAAPAADQALMATSSTAAAWRVPPVATTSLPGYLSAADKLKLDGVATSAAAVGATAATQVTVTTAAAGIAATAARSDHVHSVATAAPSALTVGGAQAAGSSASLARADHVHAMPALVTTSVDGFMSATDKTRLDGMATSAAAVGSAAATQVTVTTAASGAAATAARSDHVHSVATAAPSALTVGGAQAAGSSASLARADHVHAMPGLATGAADGFMTAADFTKLGGVEAGAQVTSFARVQTALAAASSAVSINAQRLASVADPSAAQDAATKAYVDAIAQGLDIKASVRLVATSNVAALTGNVSIDGSTTAPGQRVLLAGQTTASVNGIYLTAAGAWARTTDADTSAKVTAGMYVFATEGAANADSGWALITPDPIVLGTTALTFTQVTGAGQITAGAGLTKSGNTLDVVAHADGSIVVAADSVQVGVLATDAQHGTRAGGTTHAAAIAGGAAGFMSGSDKARLDALAAAYKTAVRAASVANIANIGIPGNNPNVVDGVSLANGDRVLVKDQLSAQQDNSIWIVTTVGTGTNGVWARASDVDTLGELVAGALVYVAEGTQAGQWWQLTTTGTLTPDVTPLAWARHTLLLSTTAPANVGTSAAVGVGTTAARSDHVHAHGAQTDGTLHAAVIAAGASGFMSGSDKTKLDGIATGAAAVLSVTPNAVDGSTGNGGAAATASRSDHRHQVTTGTPNALTMGAATAAGTSNNLVRADHIHALPAAGTPVTLTLAGVNAAGSAATLALSDHVHALPGTAAPVALTLAGTNSAGVSTAVSRSDHLHALPASSTAPPALTVGGSSAAGSSTSISKADHVHALAAPTDVIENTGVEVVGVSTAAAREDHQHPSAWKAICVAVHESVGFDASAPPATVGGITIVAGDYILVNGTLAPLAGDDPAPLTGELLGIFRSLGATWLFLETLDRGEVAYVKSTDSLWTYNGSQYVELYERVGTSTPTQIYAGRTAHPGVVSEAARPDHVHNILVGAPSTLTASGTNVEGTGQPIARADHLHNIATAAPSALTINSTQNAGSSGALARADHVHAMPDAGLPVALAIGSTQATGVQPTFSRSDHTHGMPNSGTPVALTLAASNAAGSASTIARSDHVHALPAVGFPLIIAATDANATGSQVTLARSDHVHGITTGNVPALVPGGVNSAGSGTALARADHVHAIPAYGNAAATLCQGNDVRLDAAVVPWIIETSPGSLLYADEFLAGSSPDLATRGYTCTNVATGATMTRLGAVTWGTISLTATQYNSSIVGSWLFIQTGAVMSVTKTMSAPFGCIAMRGVPSAGVAASPQRCGLLVADGATYSTSKKLMVGFVDGVSSVLALGASSQTGTGAITLGAGAAPATGQQDTDIFVASKQTATSDWGITVRKADPPTLVTEFWSLSPALADTATTFGFVVHSGTTGAGQRHVAIDYLRRYPANTFFGL